MLRVPAPPPPPQNRRRAPSSPASKPRIRGCSSDRGSVSLARMASRGCVGAAGRRRVIEIRAAKGDDAAARAGLVEEERAHAGRRIGREVEVSTNRQCCRSAFSFALTEVRAGGRRVRELRHRRERRDERVERGVAGVGEGGDVGGPGAGGCVRQRDFAHGLPGVNAESGALDRDASQTWPTHCRACVHATERGPVGAVCVSRIAAARRL